MNEANRRRFVVIPFTFQPEKVDEELPDKLRSEYPAILAWMILGAKDWYERGLGEMPEVVRDETEDYFEAQNDVQAWIDECCLVGPNYTDTSANLFRSWETWCKRNGVLPGSQKALNRTLKSQHGCRKKPRAGGRGLIGIAVWVARYLEKTYVKKRRALQGASEISRFSCMKFLGVLWGLRLRQTEQGLALAPLSMLPSAISRASASRLPVFGAQ